MNNKKVGEIDEYLKILKDIDNMMDKEKLKVEEELSNLKEFLTEEEFEKEVLEELNYGYSLNQIKRTELIELLSKTKRILEKLEKVQKDIDSEN